MAVQVQERGGTGGEGEGDSDIQWQVPPLRQWLQDNNLSDVSEQIESQFEQLNCKLEELLTFSKQDLIDFAKDDLKLKSPLKRNRFATGVLRLQTKHQSSQAANTNTIVLTTEEKQLLTNFETKVYVISYCAIFSTTHVCHWLCHRVFEFE